MNNVTTLGEFGKSFQEKLIQALLNDRQFAEQMLEAFNSQYFDLKYLQFLAEKYFAYAKKYKVFPTLQLLITIIRDELKTGNDIVLRDQIIEYLQRIRTNPDIGDLNYVKEKSLDFCRKQALKAALSNAVDQMQTEKYEQIVDGIKKAVMVGTTPSLGHDFFEDYEARFIRLARNAIPTGFPQLDKKEIFQGGAGAGELCVIIGSTGAGKCTDYNTYVRIRYTNIVINGVEYKPWQKVSTKRGIIYAKDIIESDEIENAQS